MGNKIVGEQGHKSGLMAVLWWLGGGALVARWWLFGMELVREQFGNRIVVIR